MFDPPDVDVPETAEDDPRVGRLLKRGPADAEEVRVVLLGFGSDEGVRRNGGRAGAAQAPDAIRRALYKLTPDARCFDAFTKLLRRTLDLGNLVLSPAMEENQARLGEALAPHLKRRVLPIILGGGHETSYGHFLGYVQAGQSVDILNWDAHADVRPLKDGRGHSGSPFRQALDHASRSCKGYMVAGLNPQSTARAHLDYLHQQGAAYIWRDELTPARVASLYPNTAASSLMVTFDLDAVDAAHAPGVSAPAGYGLTPDLWLAAAFEAGRCPGVTSIDLVEANPVFDLGGRTARLAALTVWHVLRGMAERTRDWRSGIL